MKYYFAPLEGITNVYYRKLHNKYYKGIDKYFIPFINPSSKMITNKEEREVNPVNNNLSVQVVPQIISKNAMDTIWLIDYLKSLGYKEVNLNFGCPSGTVTAKGRGAGILKDLDYLDSYLKEVFSKASLPISIKMRIGFLNTDEFEGILNVLNKYPIQELIIHPRTAKERYVGPLHLDCLDNLNTKTNFDIIYNGEIKSIKDIEYIKQRFPYIKGVMLGRGLISVPSLLDTQIKQEDKLKIVQSFFDELYHQYLDAFGWNNTKFYVKEIWALLNNYFDIPKNQIKKLFKIEKQNDFEQVLQEIYSTCPIKQAIENGIDE